ncbi:MAG: hypothetical protein PHR28_04320 [candidate division Zixibacteria bacterium]|nr:hypothetical protein [candidate division Zixibacteria bacterium]
MANDYENSAIIKDIRRSIDILKDLLGGHIAKQNAFWRPYIDGYDKWCDNGANYSQYCSSDCLISLNRFARYVDLFWRDCRNHGRLDDLKHRLRNPRYVEHLLFEFRTGERFINRGIETHWIGGSSFADLEVITGDKQRVLIECVLLIQKSSRGMDNNMLVNDLLKAAKGKRQSKRGANDYSRIVAIKVPEIINWPSLDFGTRIREKLRDWEITGHMRNVGCLLMMGKETVVRAGSGNTASMYFDQEYFPYLVESTRPEIPAEVINKLELRGA